MNLSDQVDRIEAAIRKLDPGEKRCLIAIGGPPASGKSTLAGYVRDRLHSTGLACGLVPMDGFHLDNGTLQDRGLLARKGAPETFDAARFVELVRQLTAGGDLSIPLFDRSRDCVLPNAAQIGSDVQYVVVEGNYLFLDKGDWQHLNALWNLKVFVSPPLDVLKRRLIKRWTDHGLDATDAERRAADNDIPNARTVLKDSQRRGLDLIFE